jgi:hypothetical protein
MQEKPKPRRRLFRFSLRTMLVVVTLVCVYLGWALNWKRERHQFLMRADVEDISNNYESTDRRSAPLALRILGERGITGLTLGDGLNQVHPEMETAARHLFPESQISLRAYKQREWPHVTPELQPWDPSK